MCNPAGNFYVFSLKLEKSSIKARFLTQILEMYVVNKNLIFLLLQILAIYTHCGLKQGLTFFECDARNGWGQETRAKSVWETRFK